MKRNYNLKLKEIYSESLVRDLILFFFLFLLVVAQNWDNMLLLLFPLITFGFAFFFKMIDVIKKRGEFENIIYNPFGNEKKHANRLIFCALLQLILLFWYGAESLYHPQLIDNYYIYFISIFVFLYTFGFYWIFLDLWKYSKIEILTEGIDHQKLSHDLDNVISFLKMKNFKLISIVNFIVFMVLNVLNLAFSLFDFGGVIYHNLPGTGIEGSEPISLSLIIYGIMIVPPSLTLIFLILNYRDINNINKEKFNKVINSLPKHVQNKIIQNLITLNKKLKFKLGLE